jgi:hypothetical protein
MSEHLIRIHNIETNEIIDREMNNAELKAYQLLQDQALAEIAEREAKAARKLAAEAKLATLGLTADDLQALGL